LEFFVQVCAALLVLRDICRLSDADAIEVSRWAAQALLKQTLAELRP
jgi:hypothetical protein